MKLWDTRDIYPDPARDLCLEGAEFGRFIPDAEGYPYIFNDHCMAQANHHKKYINEYDLAWWLKCLPTRRARENAIH